MWDFCVSFFYQLYIKISKVLTIIVFCEINHLPFASFLTHLIFRYLQQSLPLRTWKGQFLWRIMLPFLFVNLYFEVIALRGDGDRAYICRSNFVFWCSLWWGEWEVNCTPDLKETKDKKTNSLSLYSIIFLKNSTSSCASKQKFIFNFLYKASETY